VTFVMHGGPNSQFPYVFDTLEDELGIRVECTAGTIDVSDAHDNALRRHAAGEQ
jgi:hypothetical protein